MKKILVFGLLATGGILVLAAGTVFSGRPAPPKALAAAVPPKLPSADLASAPSSGEGPPKSASNEGLDAILAETDSSQQEALLKNWANSIGVAAMAETINQTDTIQDPVLRAKVRSALLASWGGRDIAGAVTWFAHRGGADPLQEQARDILARSMAERDPVAMFGWMRTALPETERSELDGPFFRQWAKQSPATAVAQLRLMIDTSGPDAAAKWNDILGQVVSQWAHADLRPAISWVTALPDSPAKSSILWQMSDAWTLADPQEAATFAEQQNDTELLKRVAGKWAENDPEKAAAWAAEIPIGPERDAATARVATIWAEDEPIRAAEYVATLPKGSAQMSAALGVVAMWARSAPADTAQWVVAFPQGATRDQAIRALVGTWAQASSSTAGQWVESLPEGNSRDLAIVAFTSATDVSSPAQAFQLALSMSDARLRDQQVAEVAGTWLQKDPVGAHSAIAQSHLSPELKNSLSSPGSAPSP